MSACSHCTEINKMKNHYLVPCSNEDEIVLLVNKQSNVAVLGVKNNTLCLNKEAINIIYDSIVSEDIIDIPEIIGKYQGAEKWTIDVLRGNMFEISDTKPSKIIVDKKSVKSGDVLNPDTNNKKIKADVDGVVSKIKINNTVLYFFKSEVDIDVDYNEEESAFSVLMNKGKLDENGDPKISSTMGIEPKMVRGGLSRNSCTACSACGVCGACILCGEVNFAAFAAAASASINTTNFG